MRNRAVLIALPVLLPLGALPGGCAGTPTPANPPVAPEKVPCRADGLARFIAATASAETGAALLAASGARTLRWAAPDSALTMDFRPDRLTVSYDRAMRITRLSCG